MCSFGKRFIFKLKVGNYGPRTSTWEGGSIVSDYQTKKMAEVSCKNPEFKR